MNEHERYIKMLNESYLPDFEEWAEEHTTRETVKAEIERFGIEFTADDYSTTIIELKRYLL